MLGDRENIDSLLLLMLGDRGNMDSLILINTTNAGRQGKYGLTHIN